MAGIQLWPMALFAGFAIFQLVAIFVLSHILGQKHQDRTTGRPYEGGIEQSGSARLRFSAHFYLVAMLFVIFDVEAVFLMLWAIGFRELAWAGYAGAAVFILLLIIVLIYEWSVGALDFGPDVKKIMKSHKMLNTKSTR